MAKIGTAHIELKPVLNEEALAVIAQRIEDAVAEGIRRGMRAIPSQPTYPQPAYPMWWTTSSTSTGTTATGTTDDYGNVIEDPPR